MTDKMRWVSYPRVRGALLLKEPYFLIVWFEEDQWQAELVPKGKNSGDVYTCDEDVITQSQAKRVALELLYERQKN